MESKGYAIITGGGRGIGASTTVRLAEAGHDVAVLYHRDAASAETTVARAVQAAAEHSHTIRGHALQVDVADSAAVTAAFAGLDRVFADQPLRVLVNNAGVLAAPAVAAEIAPERIERMFAVNVFGSFYCARETVRRMSQARNPGDGTGMGGAIVNVSSGASKSGSAFEFVDYAATKGAIDSFTIGLSQETAAQGIRVNAVRPGFIESDIHETIGDVAGRRARFLPQIPMARTGSPDEVAAAIAWLASEEASYVTGALLDISGGR